MTAVSANGITIEYEEQGRRDDPALVLVMGLGVQLIGWPDDFCEGLAGRGFRVIRFDNRDVGLSSKIEAGGTPDVAAAFASSLADEPIDAPYSLDDMAADTLGLLDALDIERAHLVGASMGGMIAQIAAARYPGRVRSLTAIMTSSGNPDLPRGKPEAFETLLAPRPEASERERLIEHMVNVYRVIGSPGFPSSDSVLRAKVIRSIDRAYHRPGFARQLVAALSSGSRVELLRTIRAPTLVIHGADDPLVPIAAGQDIADNVPGARIQIIDGMGHDLAPGLVPIVTESIGSHCGAADRT